MVPICSDRPIRPVACQRTAQTGVPNKNCRLADTTCRLPTYCLKLTPTSPVGCQHTAQTRSQNNLHPQTRSTSPIRSVGCQPTTPNSLQQASRCMIDPNWFQLPQTRSKKPVGSSHVPPPFGAVGAIRPLGHVGCQPETVPTSPLVAETQTQTGSHRPHKNACCHIRPVSCQHTAPTSCRHLYAAQVVPTTFHRTWPSITDPGASGYWSGAGDGTRSSGCKKKAGHIIGKSEVRRCEWMLLRMCLEKTMWFPAISSNLLCICSPFS